MNEQNLKNLFLKVFYFCKIFKMREKILRNPQTFFVFVLYCTKRRCSQIKPHIEVEIEDGRERSKSLVFYIPHIRFNFIFEFCYNLFMFIKKVQFVHVHW